MKRYVLFFFLLILLLLPTVFAQFEDAERSSLILTVGGESCALALKTSASAETTAEVSTEPELPEATEVAAESTAEATEIAENTLMVLTVTDDCDRNAFRLASNGTLWLAIALEDEEDWQVFTAVEGDNFAPSFDRRGRYIGCHNPNEGEQVCRVQWEYEGTVYRIEIPIFVGDAYSAGVPISTAEPNVSIPTTGTGEWGSCGSCSSCGADTSVCVTSPDGLCLADPAHCSAPPPPAATED